MTPDIDLAALTADVEASAIHREEGMVCCSAHRLGMWVPSLLSALTAKTAERDEARNAVLELGDAIIRANGWEPQNGVTVELSSALERLVVQRDLLRENRDQYKRDCDAARAELDKSEALLERARSEVNAYRRGELPHVLLEEVRRLDGERTAEADKLRAELAEARLTIAARDAALKASDETHHIAQQIVAATLGAASAAAPKPAPSFALEVPPDCPRDCKTWCKAYEEGEACPLDAAASQPVEPASYLDTIWTAARTVTCPACHVAIGEPCEGASGYHGGRLRAALAAVEAAGAGTNSGHCGLCGSEDCPGVPGQGCTPGPFETYDLVIPSQGRVVGKRRLLVTKRQRDPGLDTHALDEGDWLDPSTTAPEEAHVLHVAAGAGDGAQVAQMSALHAAYDAVGMTHTGPTQGDGEQDTATCGNCRGVGRVNLGCAYTVCPQCKGKPAASVQGAADGEAQA